MQVREQEIISIFVIKTDKALSFPHHLAVDSMAHFFLSGISNRSNPLLHFNVRIVRSAFLALISRFRLFE